MTDLHHPRLSGLGRNPAASEDILVRLAAHGAGRHGMSRRRGPVADAVVEALLEHDDGDVMSTLRAERISPAMRRRIATHPNPAIRDARADFVRQLVEFGTVVPGDVAEVYGQSLASLAAAPDPGLRAALAEAWYDRPASVQAAFLADPDPRVRAAATRHRQPGVPAEWWDRCLADPAVRKNVARYVPLTWDQFTELMRTGDKGIQRAVAGNPHLSADMVTQLLDLDDPLVRVAVAQSRHVDDAARDRLYALVEARRADGDIDAVVAMGWDLSEPDWMLDAPLDERLSYLDCPHAIFRRVLARSRDLPEEAWRRLDNDPDVAVRRTAARRPDASPDVLERLVRAHGDVHHHRPLLVEHPNFPRHTLRTFVDEPTSNVRFLALEDPDLSVPALRQLAADPNPFLRRGVARHPNITDALLDRLLSDPDPNVADDAAANPRLRPTVMDRILTEADL
ncbi:hypothetical protein ACWD3I_36935 [Streptomyces sp. NPDC002817]|uniref:hypothetical protein n=1 Tax=Streptomyces sp. NPDC088357 TaxID=3154655 RepID=UPI00343BE5ED